MKKIDGDNTKLIITILVVITLSLSITYAYVEFAPTANTASEGEACFDIEYEGQDFSTSNIVSAESYSDGAKATVTLNLSEDCNITADANIYIHTNTGDSETTAPINEVQALKYLIRSSDTEVDGTTGVIITEYEDEEGNTVIKEDLQIASVELTTTPTSYEIYIWVDSEISQGNYNNTTYSGYIYAESIQTSTVK